MDYTKLYKDADLQTASPVLKSEVPEAKASAYSHILSARNRVLSYMTHKPTNSMVIEAITALGSEGGGASLTAVIKWIVCNYAVKDMDKVKIQIKRAVLKALHNGSIERSQTSKACLGTNGSFVIGQRHKTKNLKKPKSLNKTKSKKSSNSILEKETSVPETSTTSNSSPER